MTENTPSDALVEAMARAIYEADDPWHVAWPWPDLQSDQAGVDHYRRCAQAAAAVIADALAERDAELAEALARVGVLKEDCKRLLEEELVATCEGCGAWLLSGDDTVSADPDGVTGCWASMTDLPSRRIRPCYAYRVDKKVYV